MAAAPWGVEGIHACIDTYEENHHFRTFPVGIFRVSNYQFVFSRDVDEVSWTALEILPFAFAWENDATPPLDGGGGGGGGEWELLRVAFNLVTR